MAETLLFSTFSREKSWTHVLNVKVGVAVKIIVVNSFRRIQRFRVREPGLIHIMLAAEGFFLVLESVIPRRKSAQQCISYRLYPQLRQLTSQAELWTCITRECAIDAHCACQKRLV